MIQVCSRRCQMTQKKRNATDKGRADELIARMKKARSYIYPEWEFAARQDPEFVETYNRIYELGLGEGKHVSAKVREFVAIALLAFRGAEKAGLVAHMERAIRLGATREELFEVLDTCVEAAGNFIDTADIYARWVPGNTGGESETALGIWMTARKNRHTVLIATKVMGPMGPGPNDTGLSRQHIMEGVEASLRRLQTDYIDLYQAHWDDRDTPLEETLRAFDEIG